MTFRKSGSAVWKGSLNAGNGRVSSESGALSDQPYGFATRFEDVSGTNPEELIAAAHASCFAMAFSMVLGQEGLMAKQIDAKATVTLEKQGDGFAVTASHLDVTATIPDADEDGFNAAATAAKENCPISKLLNAKVTMDAKLVQAGA